MQHRHSNIYNIYYSLAHNACALRQNVLTNGIQSCRDYRPTYPTTYVHMHVKCIVYLYCECTMDQLYSVQQLLKVSKRYIATIILFKSLIYTRA